MTTIRCRKIESLRPTRFCLSSGAALIVAGLLVLSVGCEEPSSSANSAGIQSTAKQGEGQNTAHVQLAPEKRSADQVLKDMEATYKKANTYADDAKVHLHFER